MLPTYQTDESSYASSSGFSGFRRKTPRAFYAIGAAAAVVTLVGYASIGSGETTQAALSTEEAVVLVKHDTEAAEPAAEPAAGDSQAGGGSFDWQKYAGAYTGGGSAGAAPGSAGGAPAPVGAPATGGAPAAGDAPAAGGQAGAGGAPGGFDWSKYAGGGSAGGGAAGGFDWSKYAGGGAAGGGAAGGGAEGGAAPAASGPAVDEDGAWFQSLPKDLQSKIRQQVTDSTAAQAKSSKHSKKE